MPRSSRHRSSHRQHRRRERLDSDSDGDRDSRGSASASASASEKRKVASFIRSPDENNSLEGKRGGKNVDLLVVVERWNGDDGEGREEELEEDEGKREAKMDKDRSGKKREGLGGDKRSEKDSKRSVRSGDENGAELRSRERERGLDKGKDCLVDKKRDYDHKKYREREPEKAKERRSERDHWPDVNRERRAKRGREEIGGRERDSEAKDTTREKTSDGFSIKSASRLSSGDKKIKGIVENGDRQEITEFHNFDLDKDISKRSRRKDYSSDKDKFYEDDRDSYDRRLVSIDDHARNDSYKIDKYKEERYKEKNQGDFDRDERHPRHDKHQDVRYAKDQMGIRSESKHYRDETKPFENRSKRGRVQDNGCESSPYVDECSMSHRDNKDKKFFFDNNDLCSVMKSQSIIESQSLENSMLASHLTELNDYKIKKEKYNIKGGTDSTQIVQSSHVDVVKNEFSSKLVDAARRKSEEKMENYSVPINDHSCPSIRHIDSESSGVLESHFTEKNTLKEHPVDDFQENSTASQNPTNQRYDCQTSPRHISEKPSSSSGRRYSNRRSSSPYIDSEEIKQKTSYSRDGRGYSPIEKRQDFSRGKQEGTNGYSQMDLPVGDFIPVGSLPYKRTDYLSNSSASPHHYPSSTVRHGMDNPASGSDGDKFQAGERKSNNRHRRTVDPNYGRGHVNSMKGVLNCWPSPVPNGFVPFHNGPPPGGFYPVPQPFSVPRLPPMYGVRPPMDLNQHCSPFHMNESSDGFSDHSRPFGLWNRADDPFPPNLQSWDGNNNIFSDGSYMQCRSDWEPKNHLLNNPGSDINIDSLKELNENATGNFHTSEKEMENVSDFQSSGEQTKSVFTEVNGSKDIQNKKKTKGILFKILQEPSKLSDSNIGLTSIILSNLDISIDLAGPELYKQWAKKIGPERNIPLSCQADKPAKDLDYKKEPLSIPIHNKTLCFPTLPTDTFQKAMSLYKKDCRNKEKILSSVIKIKEEMDLPECSDVMKVDSIEKFTHVNSMENIDSFIHVEENNININKLETNIDDTASLEQSDAVKNFSPDADLLRNDSLSDIMNEDADNVSTFQVGLADVGSPKHSVVEEVDCIRNPPNVNLFEIDCSSDKLNENSGTLVAFEESFIGDMASPKQSDAKETQNVGEQCSDAFKSLVNDNPLDDMEEDNDDAGNLEISNAGDEVKDNSPVVMHSSPDVKITEPGVGVCLNEPDFMEIDPTEKLPIPNVNSLEIGALSENIGKDECNLSSRKRHDCDTEDIRSATCEPQSSTIYSAVDCGQNPSQVFDSLIMAECVEKNINRIHHSPKSTH